MGDIEYESSTLNANFNGAMAVRPWMVGTHLLGAEAA